MKNKKAVYLLIGCVAIVWGLIIYRIFSSIVQEDEPISTNYKPKLNGITVANHSEDKYELHLDRDPFRNDLFAPIVDNEIIAQPSKTKNTIIVKPILQWPTISYKGYIKNPKNHQKLVIITINSKELTMAEGSKNQGIQVLKNLGDSIQLSFNHEIKYIRIN